MSEELELLRRNLPHALGLSSQAISVASDYLRFADCIGSVPSVRPHPKGEPVAFAPPLSAAEFPYGEISVENRSGFHLTPDMLAAARSIRIQRCRNFILDFGGIPIREQCETRSKFFIQIGESTGFSVRGAAARGGRNFALFHHSDNFTAEAIKCEAYEGYGIITYNCSEFVIDSCQFQDMLASGIMILGDCHDGIVKRCQIESSTGYLNCDAGIHLCQSSRWIGIDDIPERVHEPLSIRDKTQRPHRIRIHGNLTQGNRAQGIYVEGAQGCVIDGNVISENNKEGICLDWGTSYCVVANNRITGNGNRSLMTETEIAIDFIPDFPVLPDQSSSCKLPGISFDNGVLNAIIENEITDNYGGGVKMVRSAIGNLIQGNRFANNARGENYHVKRIYDIYILSLGNRAGEFDEERDNLLDFLPSSFNRFNRNRFLAPEASAIHFGSEYNSFSDNRFDQETADPFAVPPLEIGSVISDRPNVHASSADQPSISSHTLYAFGSARRGHIANLRLCEDGSIQFSRHANESYWHLDDEALLFLDDLHRTTTRFQSLTGPLGCQVFFGQFMNTLESHYLMPLFSTDGLKTTDSLPALFISTMWGLDSRRLPSFFTATGFAYSSFDYSEKGLMVLDSARRRGPFRSEHTDPYPCALQEAISILQPGQFLTTTVPYVGPSITLTTRLRGLNVVQDLRALLVHAFILATGRPKDESTNTAQQDFMTQFDSLASEQLPRVQKYASYYRHNHQAILHIEDFSRSLSAASTLNQLISFGVAEQVVRVALKENLDDQTEHKVSRDDWRQLWSTSAELKFTDSVFAELNRNLGYP